MPNFPMFERHLEMQSLKSERKIIHVENINVVRQVLWDQTGGALHIMQKTFLQIFIFVLHFFGSFFFMLHSNALNILCLKAYQQYQIIFPLSISFLYFLNFLKL
eukprot:TRINITY_DN47236_c0_g1_i1.p1 TRINITY_DN47236_c0_g1~~TRINITY_DN47236_c0_g1_i1.p1  ORF type:complete len:104 (+),score=3.19 TRINITY_DN47236_c0_g1_i1:294-605(+)